MIADIKLLLINFSAFIFSMTNADTILKIILLLLTIGYTIHKWWLLYKNKFSETRVGKFLSIAAPNILNAASELLPDAGVLSMVGKLIKGDSNITSENKEEALKLLEIDIVEMQEISKRWDSDMSSDSWMSKNTRPMTLIFLTVSAVLLIVLDSLDIDFGVSSEWIELLKSLLITVYVAYFGSRGVEKFKYISQNK